MVATALGAVAIVALVVVRGVILDDSATSVDAETAVDNFRASTIAVESTGAAPMTAAETTTLGTTDTEPTPTTPDPGVYRYATYGTESVDALGGASHAYPAETFLSVTVSPDPSDDCVRLRWDLLEERRDEWDLCADRDGIWLGADTVDWHAFFGQGELVTTDCTAPALVVPAGAAADDATTVPLEPTPMSCTRRDGSWDHQWQVLGAEILEVGGASVAVVHTRQSVSLETETTLVDWWMTAEGLPVRMTSTKRSSSETIAGTIVYTETYTAELMSLTPMR